MLPQWKHVLKDHKTPLSPPFPSLTQLVSGETTQWRVVQRIGGGSLIFFSAGLVSLLAAVTRVVGVLSSHLLPPAEERHASRGWALGLVLPPGQWRNGGEGAGVLQPRIDEKDFEEGACKP